MLDSLYEGGGQTAGVVAQLSPAGGAVKDPGPAPLADDVTRSTAGDGQVPGHHQADGALHHGGQVGALATLV